MKTLLPFILLLCNLFCVGLRSQEPALPQSMRVTYTRSVFNDFDLKLHSGIQIEYLKPQNHFLDFSFPFTMVNTYPVSDQIGQEQPGMEVGVDALVHLKYYRPDAKIIPYTFAGPGFLYEVLKTDPTLTGVGGAGLNILVGTNTYISGKAHYRFGLNDGRDNIQLSLGLLLVADRQAADLPIADIDLDGIPDKSDQCPEIPGSPELFGCPDADGDGLSDPTDTCPDIPGPAALGGCPDQDGDGVADYQDSCPEDPGLSGVEGCPDRDGDGIADHLDHCPEIPGNAATDGCPKIEDINATLLELRHAITFETGSSTLLKESHAVLDQVFAILEAYPGYHLRISGHTDSIGGAFENQALSVERARACYRYFIGRGIAPHRLSAGGYGESRPIADNRYEAGRRLNRRVEFELFQ